MRVKSHWSSWKSSLVWNGGIFFVLFVAIYLFIACCSFNCICSVCSDSVFKLRNASIAVKMIDLWIKWQKMIFPERFAGVFFAGCGQVKVEFLRIMGCHESSCNASVASLWVWSPRETLFTSSDITACTQTLLVLSRPSLHFLFTLLPFSHCCGFFFSLLILFHLFFT